MDRPRVIVIGNANIDLTSYVDVFPQEGETVLSSDFSVGMGGKGANQAVACRRAGSPTALIGAIGHDTFGEMMWEGLSNESLVLDHLHRLDTPSGIAAIMVEPSGANQIAVFVGASGMLTGDVAEKAITDMSEAQFFVSQLEIPLDVVSHAIQHAKKLGMTTVINTAPYRQIDRELLHATDWIIANEGEAQALLIDNGLDADVGEDPEIILEQIPSWSTALGVNLVITVGARGAVGYAAGEKSFHANPPPVTAVDTVGAGDCFTGYFVALLDQGFAWQQALAGAVHAATRSVESLGAQSSYPAAADAAHFADTARATLVS